MHSLDWSACEGWLIFSKIHNDQIKGFQILFIRMQDRLYTAHSILTGKNKRGDRRDESSQKGVVGERSCDNHVHELNKSRQEDINHVAVNQLQ